MESIPVRLKGTSGRILDNRRNFSTERWSGIGRRWWSPHLWMCSRNNLMWNSVDMEGSVKGWTQFWRSFPTCNNPGIRNLAAHLGNNHDHTNPARKRWPGGRQKTPGSCPVRHTPHSSCKAPQGRASVNQDTTHKTFPEFQLQSSSVGHGWIVSFFWKKAARLLRHKKHTLISNCSSTAQLLRLREDALAHVFLLLFLPIALEQSLYLLCWKKRDFFQTMTAPSKISFALFPASSPNFTRNQ